MATVFIGGSISVKMIPDSVRKRLDNIIESGFSIVLGDARGADSTVQAYLYKKKYQKVMVYCLNQVRNNIGNWQVKTILCKVNKIGRKDYAKKDFAMAQAADYGFMMWDGKSSGTLNNVLNLISMNKKCLVFRVCDNTYRLVKSPLDIQDLTTTIDTPAIAVLDRKINFSKRLRELFERETCGAVFENDHQGYLIPDLEKDLDL